MLAGTAAFLLALILNGLRPFRHLEWKTWDVRLQAFSSPSRADPDIVLFLVDQYSLDVYEKQQSLPWPWPREMYAAVIRFLQAGGAKACFFDIFMTEGSRYGVEDDRRLAEAMREAGNVFLPIFLSEEEKESDVASVRLLSRFALSTETAPYGPGFSFKSVTVPLESLFFSAKGIGNVRVLPDEDGVYRRMPLIFSYQNLLLPSVALSVVHFVEGGQKIQNIPLDESGQMIIRYHGPAGTYRTYSIAAIINSWALMEEGKAPQIFPREFAGKIVLIGLSAPGLYDLKTSPLSAVIPGVEIHAAVMDNLLHRDFVRRPSRHWLLGFAVFVALLTGIGISFLRQIWKIILFSFFCMALPVAAAGLAFISGCWLELILPEISVLSALIGASLLNYSVEGKQRRFIKNVFRHYLSPDVIERIIANPSLLRLGGEQRTITSFFSDVAGFTTISEKLLPEELVGLLNEYLSEMTDIILTQGGTLDKYEGDAIVAFWNAPLDQPDHALFACRAALACQERLAELKADFHRRFGIELAVRIGLNSGTAVVGNMGSSRRFDYTAMGDAVNLAARLESACKQYKVPILAGEATYQGVKSKIIFREVDRLRVVGKKIPVKIFQVIGEKEKVPASEQEKIHIFHQALEAYRRRDWEKAIGLLKQLEPDPLAQLYIARCEGFQQNPPPDEWDTIHDSKEK